MSTEVLNNLLIYLKETLTPDNRKWLADKLIEASSESLQEIRKTEQIDETEYLLSSKKMAEIIREGMKDVESGNYQIVNVDEL